LRAGRFDAVLLDLGLPGRNGEEWLRTLRARRDTTPVVVITARGQLHDRISVLDSGADDYLVKPFDLGELGARLRAVLRRGQHVDRSTSVLQHGALQLDAARRVVTWRGQIVPLRERELWVLEVFLREPRRTFTRAQLEQALYGAGDEIDSNAVEVYIHRLRRKITPDVIVTLRGVGYCLGPAHGSEAG
jgi:DNA-binding response OmpR family regulator